MPARRIVGAEALLRWNLPGVGILFPAEFMPMAERQGLLLPVDLYAVGEACKCQAHWKAAKQPGLPISVNISAATVTSADFLQIARDMLRGCNMDAGQIELEFSSEEALAHMETLKQAAMQLKKAGFHCSVQGFGGSRRQISELLIGLPLDSIKLDCRKYAPNNEEAGMQACIEAYRSAARTGVSVVCEGVANKEQLRQLTLAGCELMQGYALSMPVTKNVFFQMVEKYS